MFVSHYLALRRNRWIRWRISPAVHDCNALSGYDPRPVPVVQSPRVRRPRRTHRSPHVDTGGVAFCLPTFYPYEGQPISILGLVPRSRPIRRSRPACPKTAARAGLATRHLCHRESLLKNGHREGGVQMCWMRLPRGVSRSSRCSWSFTTASREWESIARGEPSHALNAAGSRIFFASERGEEDSFILTRWPGHDGQALPDLRQLHHGHHGLEHHVRRPWMV